MPRDVPISGSFLIVGVVLSALAGGCAADGLVSPRHVWLSDSEHSPYTFSDWTGQAAARTVYGQDGDATYQVAVIEDVQGPHPADGFPKGSALGERVPGPRVHYLSNANNLLLRTNEVPPGLNIRVDGFMRVWAESGSIYDPDTKRHEVAGSTPPPRTKLERFGLIKVRRVYEIQPGGTERLLWETNKPFRGL